MKPSKTTKSPKNKRATKKRSAVAAAPYSYTLTWIRSDHYHCKRCKAAITSPIAGVEWNCWRGVARIGVCKCGKAMIEYESGFIKTRSLLWYNVKNQAREPSGLNATKTP